MVFIAPFIGAAALLSSFASALPRPQDSAIGDEVAVSAPNGIPITDSAELASQTASEAQATATTSSVNSNNGYSGSYGSSGSSAADNNQQWTTTSSSAWAAATSSSSASPSYSTPTYGSGSSNWGSGYNDCVSQCIAKWGAPAASYVPSATSGSDAGSSGTGATHTVIVAPSQGVLRYVPFAVNASVGDTVKFIWGANNHTVTKSSALLPCNKSTDALFTSGTQNKDFVFTQLVNDTNPVYFHCGTPGHCQKGMFGIINPPSLLNAGTSVSGMMSSIVSNNADISAYATYTTQQTSNNAKAGKWGGNINLASVPEWAHPFVAENVLYTRNFLASNAEVMKDDGSVDLSNAGSTPLMIPQDISAVLSNAGPSNTPSASGTTSASPSASTQTESPTGNTESQNTSGARSLASPQVLISLFIATFTFFAL